MKTKLLCILLFISINGFTQDKVNISSLQMKQDISLLKSVLYNLHPGIYRYNTKEDFEKYFNNLESSAKQQMPIKQFYLQISQLVNKIKCGHTFPNPLNLEDSVKNLFFNEQVVPFFFKIINNKIIITNNVSNEPIIKNGDEILSINNNNSSTIISKLLTVSRADGNNAQQKKLNNISIRPNDSYGNTLFDIYYPLFFPHDNKILLVQIKNVNGIKKNYTLEYLSSSERLKKYETLFGKVLENENTWNCKSFNTSTTYLKFGTFAFWNSDFKWKNYIDSCFAIINKNKRVENLVIDLRGNEGGSGNISNYILSILTSKPLKSESNSTICYRYLSVPDSLKKYLSTWDKRFKQPKDSSAYTLNEIGLYQKKIEEIDNPILPNTNSFKGKVYLLVDAECSSSTFEFARTFQYNQLGQILGEPTGGTKQGLNGFEMFFFTMPNSKMEVDIPLVYFYHKNAKDEGIKPNILIAPSQKDVYNNTDPVLTYILKNIK